MMRVRRMRRAVGDDEDGDEEEGGWGDYIEWEAESSHCKITAFDIPQMEMGKDSN